MNLNSHRSDYNCLEPLGEGSHGSVVKAVYLPTGKMVALKHVLLSDQTRLLFCRDPFFQNVSGLAPPDRRPSFDNEEPTSTSPLVERRMCQQPHGFSAASVYREVKLLQLLAGHSHIVRLYDILFRSSQLILVQEFVETDLDRVLQQQTEPFEERRLHHYMYMILSAMAYCHDLRIMHRDLKPSNILVCLPGHELKVADFGLARPLLGPVEETGKIPERCYSHQVATRWYRAPELLYGARLYDESVDMWAVGCIWAELHLLQPLFSGQSDIDQLFCVQSVLGTPDSSTWPELCTLPDYGKIQFETQSPQPWSVVLPNVPTADQQLISRCLTYSGKQRLRAKEALKQHLFKRFEKKTDSHEDEAGLFPEEEKAETISASF